MKSKTEAKRLIKNGAIDIQGIKFIPPSMLISLNMKVGKKEFLKIGFEISEDDVIDLLTS